MLNTWPPVQQRGPTHRAGLAPRLGAGGALFSGDPQQCGKRPGRQGGCGNDCLGGPMPMTQLQGDWADDRPPRPSPGASTGRRDGGGLAAPRSGPKLRQLLDRPANRCTGGRGGVIRQRRAAAAAGRWLPATASSLSAPIGPPPWGMVDCGLREHRSGPARSWSTHCQHAFTSVVCCRLLA